MTTLDQAPVYVELLDLLASVMDRDRLARFRLSAASQGRLDALLKRNREGTLTADEASELDEFERIEHVVRLLKARLREHRT